MVGRDTFHSRPPLELPRGQFEGSPGFSSTNTNISTSTNISISSLYCLAGPALGLAFRNLQVRFQGNPILFCTFL